MTEAFLYPYRQPLSLGREILLERGISPNLSHLKASTGRLGKSSKPNGAAVPESGAGCCLN